MPLIYKYDRLTMEYLPPAVEARLDPIENNPMVPAFATLEAPPTVAANEIAVRSNDAWVKQADYRGETWYQTDGTEVTFTDIGASPDASMSQTLPADVVLARAKAAKEFELKQACESASCSGLVSNALGSNHTYPTTILDQQNLIAVCTAAQEKRSETTWRCKFWCEDTNQVWARKEHTADQIITVGLAVQVMISGNQDKYEGLLTTLHAATTDTQAKIDAIVW